MKKINYLLSLLISIIFFSCNTEEPFQENLKNSETGTNDFSKCSIGHLNFNSSEDLIQCLKQRSNGRKKIGQNLESNTEIIGGDFVSLMVPIDTAIEISTHIDDNIIKYEVMNSQEALIDGENLSAYYALGYDTIVPDLEFAKLLNVKGEIEVSDTIYKISPKGTYYFTSDLEEYFTNHYQEYEEMDGTLISDNIYLLDQVGIYRYGTFDNAPEVIEESDTNLPEDLNDCSMSPYVDLTNPFANEVNWDILPRERANAKTIIGKIWQSIFGCNKGFHYKISKKRRVTGKLFFYDYVIYTCTGASVKMEKKNWIGWSDTKADKLTVDWKNVVFETKYKTNPPYSSTQAPIVSNVENIHIPGFDNPEPTVSILGLEFTQNDIQKIQGKTAQQIYDYLKGKLGKNLPGNARAYMLYGPTKVITIIPNGYKNLTNEANCRVIFHEAWHFNISFDFMNPGKWGETIKSLFGSSHDNPKLISAEVRVAASLDGKWGGMTITKD